MKTKSTKQPQKAKPNVQLKDLKPKKDTRGGVRYHTGGVNVALADGSVRFVSPSIEG